jgi:hypothetical protein
MRRLWRILFLLAVSCGLSASLQAQGGFTTVTGTITGAADGLVWSCGTIAAQLITAGGVSPTLNGGGFSTSTSPIALGCPTTNGLPAGSFSMRLADSGVIVPSTTTWQFTVSVAPGIAPPAGTGPQSFTYTTAINCSTNTPSTCTANTMSISAQLSALAPRLSNSGSSGASSGSGPATGTPGAGSIYVNNSTGQIYTNNNGSFNLQSPYPVYPGLLSFGTSLSNPCNGVGTLLTVQCYTELLSYDVSAGQYVNLAVTGSQMADQENVAYANTNPQYTNNPLTILEIGVNDANPANAHSYSTANQQANYVSMGLSLLSWLSIPQTNKVFGQQCTPTSGTWTADNTTYGNVIDLLEQSTVNGSVLTCSITTYGPTLYINYRIIDGDGGTATVTVDGSSIGTINGFGVGGSLISTQNGATFGVAAITAKVAAGAHTVVFTVTSATGGGNVVSIAWLGSSPTPATPPTQAQIMLPVVIHSGVLHQQGGANDTITALFNGFNLTNVQQLSNDGLNVRFADNRDYVNTTSDMFDTLHPNVQGNVHMRDAFRAAMLPFLTPESGTVAVRASTLQTVYDNFNRANGGLGTNWTSNGLTGSLAIVSNQVTGSGTAGQVSAGYNNQAIFSPNQFAEVMITKMNATTDSAGITVRSTGQNVGGVVNMFGCIESTTTMTLFQDVNGTVNTVTQAITGAAGDIVRGEIVGQVVPGLGSGSTIGGQFLTCYQNGVSIVTSNLSPAFTVGYPGLWVTGNTMTVDNFSGGNLFPVAQLSFENDWTKPQHFTGGAYNRAVDLLAQTSAVAANTPLFTPPVNGAYAISAALGCTASSAAATVTLTVNWTDTSSTAQTTTTAAATCTTLGAASYVSFPPLTINVKGATVISYSTTIVNTPTYDLRLKADGPW